MSHPSHRSIHVIEGYFFLPSPQKEAIMSCSTLHCAFCRGKTGGEGVGQGQNEVSLPALAGADENSPRFDLESVMRLLSGKAEIERRIGGWPSGLCEEGWRRGDGGCLHGSEVERVGVCEVGRLGSVVIGGRTERRRKLAGGTVPRRLLSVWRARLALDWGRRT
jgi:hypothetical protein